MIEEWVYLLSWIRIDVIYSVTPGTDMTYTPPFMSDCGNERDNRPCQFRGWSLIMGGGIINIMINHATRIVTRTICNMCKIMITWHIDFMTPPFNFHHVYISHVDVWNVDWESKVPLDLFLSAVTSALYFQRNWRLTRPSCLFFRF